MTNTIPAPFPRRTDRAPLAIGVGSRWANHAGVAVTVTRIYRKGGIVWVASREDDGSEWAGIPLDRAWATWDRVPA